MSTQTRRRSSAESNYGVDADMSCREILHDFCENKFWCKVKVFAIFMIILNVSFFAYKFYYLATTPAVYQAHVHMAVKVLLPYWFACLIICILFMIYGIFTEYKWALGMMQNNTFIELAFLDSLLIAELVAIHKYGDKEPWNHLSVVHTAIRLVVVTLWNVLLLYLCCAYERGLTVKHEDEVTPTLLQMCCLCRKT